MKLYIINDLLNSFHMFLFYVVGRGVNTIYVLLMIRLYKTTVRLLKCLNATKARTIFKIAQSILEYHKKMP